MQSFTKHFILVWPGCHGPEAYPENAACVCYKKLLKDITQGKQSKIIRYISCPVFVYVAIKLAIYYSVGIAWLICTHVQPNDMRLMSLRE